MNYYLQPFNNLDFCIEQVLNVLIMASSSEITVEARTNGEEDCVSILLDFLTCLGVRPGGTFATKLQQ